MTNAAAYQMLILQEVKDDGTVAPLLPTIWEMYADQGSLDARLQYLYARRHALSLRLAQVSDKVNVQTDGDRFDLSDEFKHLTALAEQTDAEIDGKLRSLRGGGASGSLAATAPVMPADRATPPTSLDANDPAYRGDAYWGRSG